LNYPGYYSNVNNSKARVLRPSTELRSQA
jgi:hypothetical protein